jgi:hypothetical protein
MKKIVFLFIMLIGFTFLAQESLNYPVIDKLTYKQYLDADWKALIKTGKESLDAGIDFYYLQVRMGVAYFEQNKFRQSIKYFKKAYTQNSTDEFVAIYLYKAYSYSNRLDDARKLANGFSNTLKEQLEIKDSPIFSSVYVESKFDDWDDYQIEMGSTDRLEQTLRKDFRYYSINFEHLINADQKFTWGYTNIAVQNLITTLDGFNNSDSFNRDIKQNQIYLRYGKQNNWGSNFSISLNYILLSFDDYAFYQSKAYSGGNNSGINKVYTHAIAANLSYLKDISLFKIGMSTSISSLNESFQIQPGIDVVFYPFGNTNLFTTSNFIQQFDFDNKEVGTEFVFKQGLGFRILKLYIEPYLSWGKMTKFTESDAFVIYNSADYIQDRKGVKMYLYLFKKRLVLYTEYQAYDKINTYELNGILNQIEYNYQTLIGGIKWKF